MLALLVFVLTLALVVWRPRGLGIGWSALGGAAVDLAAGVVAPGQVPVVWHLVWNATFTLVALLVLSTLLDEAGFFHWAALHLARWARGSSRRLFPLLVLFGALCSAVFANDGAILLLTPIVLALVHRLGFDRRSAFAFAIAIGFVVDATSLPLVISNLVNIVSSTFFAVPFDRYALVMVPVDLAALAATLAVLWLVYGRHLPPAYALDRLEPPRSAIVDPVVFRAGLPLLGALLAAYFLTARYAVPVSVVTGSGALLLLALAGRWHRRGRGVLIPVGRVLAGAPWQIVWFSMGMYLVVYGLHDAGLTALLGAALSWLDARGPLLAAIGTGALSAALSSVMNNLPSVLIGALAIDQAHGLSAAGREVMVYANVVGCDLGPKFTPIGSLATLLWLRLLERKGQRITWGEYMRAGLLLTPPVLLVTLLALAGWLAWLGQ